jgi:3-oxoacyl-[acyl-carrier-protein] synthase II
MNPVVVAADMITALGPDADSTWSALLAGRSALAPSDRIHFPAGAARAPLGLVAGVAPDRPAVIQMLEPLLARMRPAIPADAFVLLATTTGEIELLEAAVLGGADAASDTGSDPGRLLKTVCEMCGTAGDGLVVSAACASATVALAHGASLIRSGKRDAVLIVACDAVSEFVYAGFSTLNALDPSGARPFDKDRRGLCLGEAAAAVLLMSGTRARSEGRPVLGGVAGWAMSNDATHATRPDAGGAQLARAARTAIGHAGIGPGQVAFISAHGTGTRHNDAMEMAAFRGIFGPRPVFSIKGGIGHTLGAAGLVEAIVSLRALAGGVVPPSAGLCQPDDDAAGWVSAKPVSIPGARFALATNSGFGGINAALVLTIPDGKIAANAPDHRAACSAVIPAPRTGIGWITGDAFGCVREGESREYSGRLHSRLLDSVDSLFQRKVESFGRFDPVSKMACCACALALRDAGMDCAPGERHEIGIIGAGFTGSLEANRAYFKDYVAAGRILARGNLFVSTLPSAPLGEAAIHFGLQGPLFAIIAPAAPMAAAIEIARGLVNDGAATAMLVVQADSSHALAALVAPDSPVCPLLFRLAESSVLYPQLPDLITTISTNPIRGTTPCE